MAVLRWYTFAHFCFYGLVIGIILYGCTGCAPPAPPQSPAPIKAPPPGYGKKIVLMSMLPSTTERP
jgi:hypothetical protein